MQVLYKTRGSGSRGCGRTTRSYVDNNDDSILASTKKDEDLGHSRLVNV